MTFGTESFIIQAGISGFKSLVIAFSQVFGNPKLQWVMLHSAKHILHNVFPTKGLFTSCVWMCSSLYFFLILTNMDSETQNTLQKIWDLSNSHTSTSKASSST